MVVSRYIVVSDSYWMKDLGTMLRKTNPKLYLPKMEIPEPIMGMIAGAVGLPRDQFK